MKTIVIALIFSLIFTGCVAILPFMMVHPMLILSKHDTPTHRFEGYAFDAILNGVPIIELTDKEDLKSLEKYYDKRSIHWQSMKPIAGLIHIEIKRKYIKEYDIGEVDVKKFRLTCIRLPWEKKTPKLFKKEIDLNASVNIDKKSVSVAQHSNVLIGGVPYNSSLSDTFPSVNIVEGQPLPDGNYIIMIQIQGTEGWDRKEIYVEVRADAKHKKFL